jgi:GST-like protein
MICYPWCVNWAGQGQDINDFKYVKRWFEALSARPAVQRGMAVGDELRNDPASLSEAERAELKAMLYNQRARPAPETGGLL